VTDPIRTVWLSSAGHPLGEVLDAMRAAGHPVHLVSRVLNDLLAEGLLRVDEEQVIRR
jgi:hypothetical protein